MLWWIAAAARAEPDGGGVAMIWVVLGVAAVAVVGLLGLAWEGLRPPPPEPPRWSDGSQEMDDPGRR